MTYETLIKYKKIYEDNGDKVNLEKVERALKNYSFEETKPKKEK